MGKEAKTKDEFAAVMQLLSAEAEKRPPADALENGENASDKTGAKEILGVFHLLNDRIQRLETALSDRIDQLANSIPQPALGGSDLLQQFQKVDEQLSAIRSTESVNQRLFDSLHEELLKYRDNFLHESLQKPFIHDLVHLFDDLTSLSSQLQSAAEDKSKRGPVAQWHDNLENAVLSLLEILHRFEVKEIEPGEKVDRALHKVLSYEPADYAEEDGRIVMRVKRGFLWRGKLIRAEEVIAKRFG
jgi:molecular chaperone GrpE (heat shock protein)